MSSVRGPLGNADIDVYDQSDAEGFITLFGLPMKVNALLNLDGSNHYKEPDYSKFKRD